MIGLIVVWALVGWFFGLKAGLIFGGLTIALPLVAGYGLSAAGVYSVIRKNPALNTMLVLAEFGLAGALTWLVVA